MPPASVVAGAPVTAGTALVSTAPKSSKPVSSSGAKGASQRAPASDDAAQASQMTALAMLLLAPNVQVSRDSAAVGGTQEASDQSSDASAVSGSDAALDNVSGLSNAWIPPAANGATPDTSPAMTPPLAPASANAPNNGTASTPAIAAVAAVTAAATVTTADATAVAGATAATTSASGDRAEAANTSSTADLSALASLVRALPGGAVQGGAAEHAIAVPVSDPGWPHAVAAQVQLFAAANIQSATLRLSPEHLGPVEVHIDVQASQINVSFVAAHAETRSALEQSVPMLRAMLAHGGLTLGQTHVQGEARSGSQSFAARTHSLVGAVPGEEPNVPAVTRTVGLIDEYA